MEGSLRADLGLIEVEHVKLEAGGRPHLTLNRVTAARVFMAARPWSTPSKRSQTQRCLCAERRWNRTGDLILTIDARVVHDAMHHPALQDNRAGESCCREVGSQAA
jgi:hypothetical protein